MPRVTVPKHGPGCRPLAGTRSPLVLVTLKDEGADGHGRFGPVVVIRVERPTPEVAASAAAGVPFAYEQGDATDLGWLSEADSSAIAADHGVPLTFW
jgi:hypothetical protein